MKRRSFWVAVLTLLCCCLPAKAQTYTGRKAIHSNAGAATTSVVTITNQAAGNTNLTFVYWCDDSSCGTQCTGDSFTLTDTAGNTYNAASPDQTLYVTQNSPRYCMAVLHASSIATSASNTLTLTPTSGLGGTINYATVGVSEWGNLLASPVDQKGTVNADGVTGTITITAAGATAQNNEVIYALCTVDGSQTLVAGSGYTQLNSVTNVSDEYQIVSTTATYTATMTYSGSRANRGILVTYKGAPRGGSIMAGNSVRMAN